MIGWSISSNLKIIFFSHLEVLLRILDIFKSVVKVLTVIIQYNSQNFILRLQDFVLHLEARLPFLCKLLTVHVAYLLMYRLR
ncbi:uncharacterized protein OCT59_011709 [Rhizophagus irregularis]|uniref:uncharacterized protein n=1 Tax=Rhizophagus irregularis TaxID=588596 RepID=UPI000CB7E406|nr:hypothetical protein OCT59_011709 [Rhizophagus irregularis]